MLICRFSSNAQLHEEFRQQVNGYKHNPMKKSSGSLFMEPNFLQVPKQVDWTAEGYVTEVKDQVSLFRVVGSQLITFVDFQFFKLNRNNNATCRFVFFLIGTWPSTEILFSAVNRAWKHCTVYQRH